MSRGDSPIPILLEAAGFVAKNQHDLLAHRLLRCTVARLEFVREFLDESKLAFQNHAPKYGMAIWF